MRSPRCMPRLSKSRCEGCTTIGNLAISESPRTVNQRLLFGIALRAVPQHVVDQEIHLAFAPESFLIGRRGVIAPRAAFPIAKREITCGAGAKHKTKARVRLIVRARIEARRRAPRSEPCTRYF